MDSPSDRTRQPDFSSDALDVIVSFDTEAMEANTSPLKPKVEMPSNPPALVFSTLHGARARAFVIRETPHRCPSPAFA